MAATDHLGLQFEYKPPTMALRTHLLNAKSPDTGEVLGHMQWGRQGIHSINVEPEHQRQGIGTSLWNEGHRIAEENARIPKPKHSHDRTDAGTAWAKAVGGRLPRPRG